MDSTGSYKKQRNIINSRLELDTRIKLMGNKLCKSSVENYLNWEERRVKWTFNRKL